MDGSPTPQPTPPAPPPPPPPKNDEPVGRVGRLGIFRNEHDAPEPDAA